jgi:predicted ribosome quality control (RQC) complex YloA/Tae2 family protein
MQIEISLNQSVEENAATYFELAKKAKRKMEGAKKALLESRKKLEELQKKEYLFLEEEQQKRDKKDIKREWYEKFHWFFSSEGFLCIGGKDATSNEIVIKKHTDPDDLVFHTDMAGSPFFVIKDGQKAGEATLNETAQAVGVYSRAWKLGHGTADVFYVKPEQVTKEAKAGEYVSKGSFMVYGKTNYLHPKLEYAFGLVNGKVLGGPVSAIKKQTEKIVIVISGKEKKSDLAKKVKHKLGGGDLDEITKFLPSGEGEVKK